MRRIDLHMHTSRSDGRFPADEVLSRCVAGRLDFVALTDHDLPPTLAPGPRTVGEQSIHLIAGAEVSGVHAGSEFHLLVYFPADVPEEFSALCKRQVAARVDRYEAAAEALGLTAEIAPEARSGQLALTRHHLARALVESGRATDMRDAFTRFVGDHSGTVAPMPLPFTEAIQTARECGGVTSWAHPPRAAVEAHVETFAHAGLQGLEGLRPKLDSSDRRFYRRICERSGLFLTAGSDWHGWHDPDLGLFFGEPVELRGFLTALEAAA